MKTIFTSFIIILLCNYTSQSIDVIVKNDNGSAAGYSYNQNRNQFEESTVLRPDGPCKIKKLQIYFSGDKAVTDSVRICGYPTAGNLYPTQYIWSFNQLTSPITFQYTGTPGWVEIDIESRNLRSDGFDRFVITHIMRTSGPWFTYDNNSLQDTSWVLDPYTPNPNFYNIIGTLYSYAPGDFMVRFVVEYINPIDSTSTPQPPPSLVNVTSLAGLTGDRNSSVVDINGDGLDDISFSNGLFINNGDGTFKKAGAKLQIPNGGTAWGDFDNDNFPDVYAIVGGSQDFDKKIEYNRNKIYKNYSGDSLVLLNNAQTFQLPYPNPSDDFYLSSKFANDTIPNPYNTISPLWFDYNQDGFLDLFIANRRIELSQGEIFCPDQIWKNNGNGTFKNTRKTSGIDLGEPYTNGGYYDCYGASACDYNNDRKVDLFVANYRLIKDNLYKNNGNETFTEVGAATGVQGEPTAESVYFGHGMGAQWGDFDNNGLIDLCVGNLAHTDQRGIYSNPSLIYRNQGSSSNFKFKEQHYNMGLKFHEGNAGVAWLDLNLDGYLDLWHGKYSGGFGYFYLNEGPPDFKLRDMTWYFGAVVDNSWVAVYTDYDRDGDLDMIVEGRLFRNDIERKGNWVAFRLSGSPADKVSTEAFGTKLSVHCGNDTYYREIMGSSAGSLCTQNTLELHFGIGKHSIIDSVLVMYPNGENNVIKNLNPNAHYKIPYKQAPVQLGISTPALIYPANNSYNIKLDREFEWTSCFGADKYNIQVSDKSDFSNLVIDQSSNVNKLKIDGLQDNKAYYWRVNTGTKSPWSSVYVFVPGVPVPSAPVLRTPANDSANVSTFTEFSWNASTYPCQNCAVTKYELEVREVTMIDTVIIAVSVKDLTDTKYQVKPHLKPNTKYSWRVRGYNAGIPGDWSETFKYTTTPLPAKITCTEPANNATEVSTKPTFKWQESKFTLYYELHVATDIEFKNIFFSKADIPSNVYKIFTPRLNEGTDYFWRVRGLNDGGEGEWSDVFKFKTSGQIGVNDEINKTDFEVFPNPAGTSLNLIIYNSVNPLINLSLFDLTGSPVLSKLVQSEYFTLNTFDISSLDNGIYFLRITDGSSFSTRKITIIK